MTLREQFEKEMNNPGTVFGMPDYIKWLENKLETLVQQSLSGSDDKSSSPKSCPKCKSNDTEFYQQILKPRYCKRCGHDF